VGTGRCPRNIEWLRQPLGFESLALRGHSIAEIQFDKLYKGVILKVFRGHRAVPSPD
jgi:hypothetical protein